MDNRRTSAARFHLPGLFEFYDFYKAFLPLFYDHREWFYDDITIGSVYGAPADCLWGGGRVGFGEARAEDVLSLLRDYGISARLTFSNSLLCREHLNDGKCRRLCTLFEKGDIENGVIVHSEILTDYLTKTHPGLYLVSSTTKVLTRFEDFKTELSRKPFRFVVLDFRLNKAFERLSSLSGCEKRKTEFLCNECCPVSCTERKACYENVSRKSLGEPCLDHICRMPGGNEGYRFSTAMKSPAFISLSDIRNRYLPMGFSEFKIEGRGLGSAVLLEFLLYYLTKPEYHLLVREELYLDSMLDLF